MDKRGLKFIAALLTTGILVVPFMGLDDLPRDLRGGIEAERVALADTRQRLQHARQEAGSDLARAIPGWEQRVSGAEAGLKAAEADMVTLAALYEANRREDREQAEKLLAHERAARTPASAEAGKLEAEAHRLAELKRRMPELLGQMERDYQAVKGADLAPVTAAVEKAGRDWPGKKPDLDARLEDLRGIAAGAEKTWTESEPQRRMAAARDWGAIDAAVFVGSAEALSRASGSLSRKTAELNGLTGQLYESWDRVLVDQERRGGTYREKLRTVRTREGKSSSDERWTEVSRAEFRANEKHLGMAIAHKPVGKYDSEAERTAQPAGFAYMAPPGQSNQYGRWESRGGQSFWVWYGQYALLRDLLFNRGYRPVDRGDWESYRESRRSGSTYYGRRGDSQPRYGTAAPDTQSRYSGSKYALGGGFRDSKYAARGGFGGSKYERFAPSARSFGSLRSRSSPRLSFGGGGRSFGRRR